MTLTMFRNFDNSGVGSQGDLTCKEFVDLVTDYLEHTLDRQTSARFEDHLTDCPDCPVYLRQMEEIIGAVGILREEDLTAQARDVLLSRFRSWKVES